MKAAWYTKFGPADQVLEVGEIPTPEPAPGEVRVAVAASGINPVDVKRRMGGRGEMSAERVIPHFDGAGVIDAVGEGVPGERVGRRVWLYEAQWQRDVGTAAEYVCLPAHLAAPLPDSVSFHVGAGLGIPALTAYACVFGDGSVDGQTVLVTGGAGAVGSYAVQFAALSGARVLATVSSGEKAEIAMAAGAEATIDYREESVPDRVRELTNGAGVDRIVEVEFGGNLEASVEALKTRGVIATYASAAVPEPTLPFYEMMYRNITVRMELVFLMSEAVKARAVSDIDLWMTDGHLRHGSPLTFPLDDIVGAHQAVEVGTVGKVILDISG